MKTSQIRKFMPLQAKPIRLKFENIKNQESNLKFSTEDLPNITFVYNIIQDTLKNGHTITQDTLRLIFDIVRRVKKSVDQMDASSNKIRFRVVKSAKKQNHHENFKQKNIQAYQELNKSTVTLPILSLCQNRVQSAVMMESKQNCHYSCNNSIYPKDNSSSGFSFSNSKIKLKKFDLKPLQISQITEIKTISHQQVDQKLRTHIKGLIQQIQDKNKKIKDLEQIIDQSKKRNQDKQNFSIDLKFSLKCLEDEWINKQKNKEKMKNNDQNVQVKNKLLQVNQKYIEQHINHLKLMIVSQSKQIEALHKKISEAERDISKKSSRWNSY